jgi:ankyrin repeat protein
MSSSSFDWWFDSDDGERLLRAIGKAPRRLLNEMDPLEDGGWTPLMVATFENNARLVQALIECGASTTLRMQCDGTSAMHLAAQQNSIECARLILLSSCRDNDDGDERPVTMNDCDGWQPLHVCAQFDSVQVAEMIVEHVGPDDVDARNCNGATPLYVAAEHNGSRVAELLVKAGAYCDFPTLECVTPLHVAARRGSIDVARVLIAAGADLDMGDADGRTALHHAALSISAANAQDIVELLLANGANGALKSFDGKLYSEL